MGASVGCGEQGGRIQLLDGRAAVVVKLDAIGERRLRQQRNERRAVAGSKAVMQLEIGALVRKLIGHGQHGRDADAAAKQQVSAG
ncbi:hypothetical protein D3C75_1090120 [compost metagenome]